jgi:starch synthase
VNLLKAGLLFADALGTVSPTYAREIQTKEFGFGLEGVVKRRAGSLRGILNGLDYALWDPATDGSIAKNYSAAEPSGKAACKADLQKTCGFPQDPGTPVLGIVTRLAEQKGLDLLSEICDRLLAKNVQLVMLGDGDAVYRTTFSNVAKRHPKNASVNIGFLSAEAHKIYAGSDFFLMPSYFEPCGLGQLISLKYGTVPVVRETGGLADTIVDADADAERGNGFSFGDHSPESFLRTIERALKAFADPKRLRRLRATGMRADFSWKKSASDYESFYREIRPLPAMGAAA